MGIHGKFNCLVGLTIALLLSGCANSTRVIQNVGLGEISFSLGWAGYPKEGYGMIADFRSYRYDDDVSGTRESVRGFHLGVTRKLNDNIGAHLGVALGGERNSLGGFGSPDGGYVLGIQYLTDSRFSLGIQYDGVEDEPMVTLGIEDPLWFMTIIDGMIDGAFDDDDDDDFFDSH